MQRAITTLGGGVWRVGMVCLRCRMLAGLNAGQMALPLSFRRGVSNGRWPRLGRSQGGSGGNTPVRGIATVNTEQGIASTAASSPSSSVASGVLVDSAMVHQAMFVGLKKSEKWDDEWFQGNQSFAGYEGGAGGDNSRLSMKGDGKEDSTAGKEAGKRDKVEVKDEDGRIAQEVQSGVKSQGDEEETIIPKPLRKDHEPPDERTVNLGKTIRTLQSSLPTLLQSPLPSEILSPHIALHLFPSSHPHLPSARGRVAYKTALWTSPFVWGQLPGRVRLEVLAERVVKPCERGEELRVRWRAFPSTSSSSSSSSSSSTSDSPPRPLNLFPESGKSEVGGGFTGLFIFTFDDIGRILSHTIEHADEGWSGEGEAGYGLGAAGGRIVGVAEWLLKKARQAGEGGGGVGGGVGGKEPGLVFVREVEDTRISVGKRRG